MTTDTTATAETKLTAAEVGARLGLSAQQVLDMCREGVFAHHRYDEGKRPTIRIPEAEVTAYLARTFVPAKSEEPAA